jgi:DNA gyrase subunit A
MLLAGPVSWHAPDLALLPLPNQADAVLSMALRRLTSLEAGRLNEEAATLAKGIAGLTALLADPQLVLDTVKRESQEVADRHGDERRTAVCACCMHACMHALV